MSGVSEFIWRYVDAVEKGVTFWAHSVHIITTIAHTVSGNKVIAFFYTHLQKTYIFFKKYFFMNHLDSLFHSSVIKMCLKY